MACRRKHTDETARRSCPFGNTNACSVSGGGTNHGCRRWSGGTNLAGDHRRRDSTKVLGIGARTLKTTPLVVSCLDLEKCRVYYLEGITLLIKECRMADG